MIFTRVSNEGKKNTVMYNSIYDTMAMHANDASIWRKHMTSQAILLFWLRDYAS